MLLVGILLIIFHKFVVKYLIFGVCKQEFYGLRLRQIYCTNVLCLQPDPVLTRTGFCKLLETPELAPFEFKESPTVYLWDSVRLYGIEL